MGQLGCCGEVLILTGAIEAIVPSEEVQRARLAYSPIAEYLLDLYVVNGGEEFALVTVKGDGIMLWKVDGEVDVGYCLEEE
jgi:hypothetical protein